MLVLVQRASISFTFYCTLSTLALGCGVFWSAFRRFECLRYALFEPLTPSLYPFFLWCQGASQVLTDLTSLVHILESLVFYFLGNQVLRAHRVYQIFFYGDGWRQNKCGRYRLEGRSFQTPRFCLPQHPVPINRSTSSPIELSLPTLHHDESRMVAKTDEER